MKANFALSLSFEGIRLLHRAAGGWRRVGEVALDAPDLAAALSDLRGRAEALEPGGIASKLIIPDGQIKYLTIESGDLPPEDRHPLAYAALDGATPYAVDDLAFDTAPDGAQTHIAAVALETLAEAEAFAVQYGFNPISTVAVPGEAPFLGEPFFGPTAHAAQVLSAGDVVEPDGIAVVEIAAIPDAPDASTTTAEEEADAPVPESALEADHATTSETPPTTDEVDTTPPRRFALKATEADRQPDTAEDSAAGASLAVAGFASRRRGAVEANADATPSLGGVTRTATAPPAPRDSGQIIAASIPGLDDMPEAPALDISAPAPRAEANAPPDLTTPSAAAASLRKPVPPDIAGDAPQSAASPPPARSTGFLSRRQKSAAPAPAPSVQTAAQETADEKAAARAARATERQRLTIFGARKAAKVDGQEVVGKPRYLGLILTAALLLFLAGVAAWAALFVEDGVARFFKAPPDTTTTIDAAELETEPEPGAFTASLDLEPLLEGAPPPRVLQPEPAPAPGFDADAAAELYAVTGIWSAPPEVPPAPRAVPLDGLYQTSIDRGSPSLDAIALPPARDYGQDVRPNAQVPPPPQGTRFSYDSRGLIVPRPDGALSPDGFTVFAGRPPARPPARPAPQPADPVETAAADAATAALSQTRPRTRPDGLVETTERRSLGGISRAELAELRPRLRPQTDKEEQEEADQTPTEQAIARSLRPDARPRNFAQIVATAQQARPATAPETAREPEPEQTASVAPRTVAPPTPSRTSVAQQATVQNALNLRKVNLMGVYGKPSDRSALVRLANGRYRKVQVGDRLDGGRVSAIGEAELRYQKNGRNISLKMPRS